MRKEILFWEVFLNNINQFILNEDGVFRRLCSHTEKQSVTEVQRHV
jgi:hypothetical protein